MTSQHFAYELDKRWLALFFALGVKESDGVDLTDDGKVIATYGRFGAETTVDNVKDTKVTGPHRWYTAVGLRLSMTDDGLTFGTNHRKGLCISFVEPIPKVIGTDDHTALWVSVADPEGLANALGK